MGVRSWIRGSVLAQAVVKPTELFAGVEKPSTTLVYMLVAEMLKNVDKGYNKDGNGHLVVKFFDTEVTAYSHRIYNPTGSDTFTYSVYSGPVFNGHRLTLDETEKKILAEGFVRFKELSDKWKASSAEEQRQSKALDIISSMLKVDA